MVVFTTAIDCSFRYSQLDWNTLNQLTHSNLVTSSASCNGTAAVCPTTCNWWLEWQPVAWWPLTLELVQNVRTTFPPMFSFLRPSILDLGSGTRQTDRRTDNGHQSIMSPPYGGAGITRLFFNQFWLPGSYRQPAASSYLLINEEKDWDKLHRVRAGVANA